ncbi:MAG TPA: class I SAM-dependent methyltransferase [Tepidisphaeraceae bacterium]|jgi:2-polyprenyl-3-methyl-5-hydroxy-6-metoxy-1,4-benzoquinol methylase|nr:class I SAM-dependent methyltransferase [Tepidisphaeraceae bacterium]
MNHPSAAESDDVYKYNDDVRTDILAMIPAQGAIIGSVGCGAGATEGELVKSGRVVHGVDISEHAIRIAATRLTSARVVKNDDLRPFEPNSLDGLILADVIEHMPAAWIALARFAEAVRPGGWVVISVPNMRYVEPMVRFLVQGDWPEDRIGIFDSTHLQVMSRRRLQRWCEQAGLHVERWFTRYDPRGPRRRFFFRALDVLTLGLFHTWFVFQVQCLCYKPARSTELDK